MPRPTRTPRYQLPSTAIPLVADDPFQLALNSGQKQIAESISFEGADQAIYSLYIFVDTAFSPTMWGYGEDALLDSCHVVAYRTDSSGTRLILDKAEPYPQPVICHFVDWDREFASEDDKKILNMSGYSSDINQNGLQEFTVFEWWCPNACDDITGFDYSVYEIDATSNVINITENLSGSIPRYGHVVHSQSPLTINVFDPIEYEHHTYIELDRIFQWDDSQYVDVTKNYGAEYRALAQEIVENLQSRFGQSLDFYVLDFVKILAIYERANLLRPEGLELFLDVTDLSHWPNTEKEVGCWIQVARAYVQEEFKKTGSLVLPPSPNYLYLGPVADFPNSLAELGIADYDLSLCR